MNALHKTYGDRVQFLLVYIREAHPCDGWAVKDWSELDDAKDDKARAANAEHCRKELEFAFPIAIDTMEDATARRWSGWPERLFVISKEGRVLYTGDQGPFGFNPGGEYKGFDGKKLGVSLEDFLSKHVGPLR